MKPRRFMDPGKAKLKKAARLGTAKAGAIFLWGPIPTGPSGDDIAATAYRVGRFHDFCDIHGIDWSFQRGRKALDPNDAAAVRAARMKAAEAKRAANSKSGFAQVTGKTPRQLADQEFLEAQRRADRGDGYGGATGDQLRQEGRI
jgi:hypothetical protein